MNHEKLFDAAYDIRRLARGSSIGDGATTGSSKLVNVINGGVALYKSATEVWGAAKTHLGYTMAVTSHDSLYWPLQRWITGAIPASRRRASVAQSDWSGPTPLLLKHDGEREQFIKIDGHWVSITVKTSGATDTTTQGDLAFGFKSREPERIVMTAFSKAGRDAVSKLLERLAFELVNRTDAKPDLWVWTKNGWQHAGELHPRRLETVVLAEGQVERIVSSLDEFASKEQRYMDLGLPWHHGFLFHGPPGTGKSSIARAIATYFNRDLYYLGISGLESDEALFSAIAGIRRGSVLLLEDMETIRAATDTQTDEGVTQGGLRNALDGVMTPWGMVTIGSTNELDSLDDVVVRTGRFDVIEEIGYVDRRMVERIYEVAFGKPLDLGGPWERPETSPAEVVGAIKPHLDDPLAAAVAIDELNAGRLTVEVHRSRPSVPVSEGPGTTAGDQPG